MVLYCITLFKIRIYLYDTSKWILGCARNAEWIRTRTQSSCLQIRIRLSSKKKESHKKTEEERYRWIGGRYLCLLPYCLPDVFLSPCLPACLSTCLIVHPSIIGPSVYHSSISTPYVRSPVRLYLGEGSEREVRCNLISKNADTPALPWPAVLLLQFSF